MAVQQEPRNGIFYNWDQGTNNWKVNMDGNLRYLGSMLNVSAIDITNTPPGSPSDGDTYIAGPVPTGFWAGQANNIAIWFDDDGQWRFFIPTTGLLAFVQTGTHANRLAAFNGTVWSTAAGSLLFAFV